MMPLAGGIALFLMKQEWDNGFRQCLRGCGFFCFLLAISLCAPAALGQLSTEDHLAEPGFWPTQDSASRDNFVGSDNCARCHASKAAAQKKTPMARAAMSASLSDILHAHPLMVFGPGKFQYRIETGTSQSRYSVSDGNQSLSFPLLWAFGTGRVGQSYLFKKQSADFFEARVTYFENLGTLGFTPSRALLSPSDIEEAMDRPVPETEVMRCFGCHTTASSIGGHFDEAHLVPGVTCEACHGPGAVHVQAMGAKTAGVSRAAKPDIFNSADLDPADAVDFCGACHGTWWDVKLAGVKGVSTARSAPYRLVTSKCWGKGDVRLTCTACHDPHEQLQTNASAYDKACLNCHVNSPGSKKTASHAGPACPVATTRCTSCHMVKVFVPEMNDNFTDHRIRIAKAGEAFPD
jgi:cytochrome c554/c'-like protein